MGGTAEEVVWWWKVGDELKVGDGCDGIQRGDNAEASYSRGAFGSLKTKLTRVKEGLQETREPESR